MYFRPVKIWRNLPIFLIPAVFQISGAPSHALEIPVRADWKPSNEHRATPAYVWQNDPVLLKQFGVPSVTNFCVPSAIGTALIGQFLYESPPASELRVPGLRTDASGTRVLDTNAVLVDLVRRCRADVRDGTTFDNAVRCSAEFYRESGYSHAKVRIIRKSALSLAIAGAVHEDRIPTESDLRAALDEGYQVIASLAMIRFDESRQEWVKVTSHSLNLIGFKPAADGKPARIFVTNPTRAYFVDGVHPLADEATLVPAEAAAAATLPPAYAPLLFEGRLLNRPGAITVLAGLLLLRAR